MYDIKLNFDMYNLHNSHMFSLAKKRAFVIFLFTKCNICASLLLEVSVKKKIINYIFTFLKNENKRQYIKVHLNFIKNIGLIKYINSNLKYVLSLYPKNFDTNLSIVAIVKNETPYIKEWIEYHKIVGVEKFYIYDNDSEDNLKETLQSYIDTGEVVYEHYSGQGVQMSAYQKAIAMYKNHSRYMAFVDIDEFITPIMHDTIPEFIAYFEQNICKNPASIGINWLMHGFNGHNEKPQGLVCENFCRCDYATGANQHPLLTQGVFLLLSIHTFLYTNGMQKFLTLKVKKCKVHLLT